VDHGWFPPLEPDGPVQIRTFHDPKAARQWINSWQGKRNLYFQVNSPRSDLRKKATKGDISTLRAFHVDLDAPGDADPEKARAELLLPRLNANDPVPSVIIDSGCGLQSLWLLDQPIALNGANSIARLEAYNRQLEIDLGADHCHNIDRILRLPGTINLPNARKRVKGRSQYLATLLLPTGNDAIRLTSSNQLPSALVGAKPMVRLRSRTRRPMKHSSRSFRACPLG
jgi:hypothetical protein